jgi:hypothetical protein
MKGKHEHNLSLYINTCGMEEELDRCHLEKL